MADTKTKNVTKSISMTPEQLEKLNAIAVDKYMGNESMAAAKAIELMYDELYERE